MRSLRSALVDSIVLPAPATPKALFDSLCTTLSERRARPVRWRAVVFPLRTVSGLWMGLEDRDLIAVERNADPLLQLMIFGHEVWHMEAGHCGGHGEGASIAARLLADEPGMGDVAAALRVSARTEFARDEEMDAEMFGLELGTELRAWLAPVDGRSKDLGELAGRIAASLSGRRRGSG
ncbi:toxin-antitoxin system, toxin component [Streptomyces sp. NBC_01304]|uniref:toxin-antitoxin system, toxin component n=1 Tax=Streptomyces sp. NBC_01304 TaxID=2903818 RepID=UPI002E100BAC|nr:toxin-antitoxin system, toxin component [Streptomyces sp. NBC_01304]